jgi:hypothetical protein
MRLEAPTIMPENLPTKRDAAPSRLRGTVTTILLIMLSVMIVRDIFVRRWGSADSASAEVTRRSP